jgi:hypothetical protein
MVALFSSREITIALGKTSIGIYSPDGEFIENKFNDYRPFFISGPPDFRIGLFLRTNHDAVEVKRLLTCSRVKSEGHRHYSVPELFEYNIDWEARALRVDIEKALFAPEVDYKLMNYVLRGIYSGIYKILRKTAPDAYLVHGCGIQVGQRCYLFTGASGAGKSTVARLAGGRKILNDEAVLVGKNGQGFHISGSPLEGDLAEKSGDGGQLSAIFFLEHSAQVTLQKLSRTETYYRFLCQALDTSPLFELPGLDTLSERADLSAAVAKTVPAYRLGFRPDNSFWEVVENV